MVVVVHGVNRCALAMAASELAFIAVDTEDDSRELWEAGRSSFEKTCTRIAAVCSDGSTFENAGDVPAFLAWLDKRHELYVFAHNCQYDLGNLFGDSLDALDWTLISGRFIRARWHKKTFLDSHNLWPMPLARLGDHLGIKKLSVESAGLADYCLRDAEIVRASMGFVVEMLHSIGSLRMPATIGGLAVSYWRCMGGKNCGDTSEFSRLASYGGRVELFKLRNESAHVAWTDINSLYPSVMRGDFPLDMVPCGTKIPEFGFVDATVVHLGKTLGMLPARDHEGRVCYPVGRFRGVWAVPELREAESSGMVSIHKVHDCLGSKYCERPYREFVERVYGLRQNCGDGPERTFYKLLLNNLYGRLGSRCEIERTVNWVGDKETVGQRFGVKELVKYKIPATSPVNWAHAAYVAAYGRIILSRFIRKVGVERMIYADTDSCIFDCEGKELPFDVGTGLGQMKLEGWESECICYAPKVYRLGQRYVAKGVPVKHAKAFVESGRAEYLMPFKFRESILFYDKRNTRKLSVWHKVCKTRALRYKKKRLEGNRFLPYKIG